MANLQCVAASEFALVLARFRQQHHASHALRGPPHALRHLQGSKALEPAPGYTGMHST